MWLVGLLFWGSLYGSCRCDEPAAPISSPEGEARENSSPSLDAESQKLLASLKSRETLTGLSPPKPRAKSWRRGVSLGLFVSERDPEARRFYYEQLLDEIAESGATDLSLIVRWVQPHIRATTIEPKAGLSAEDAVLEEVIQLARARKLRVFLMPILHLEKRRRGEWRGKIRPSDWDSWWVSYKRFILHYATLAQRQKVELFAVGSELVSTEAQQDRWREIIQAIRATYKGQLTYSANWDHFEPVQFWDALDIVGVTAYHELSKEPDPTEENLLRGWLGFRQRLRIWAALQNRHYIFTEIGYPSHTQAAARPWDYTPRGAPDTGLQLRCYRAMYKTWQTDERLEGLFLWNWFGVGGAGDRGYSPRGKPAEDVLRYWYVGSQISKGS